MNTANAIRALTPASTAQGLRLSVDEDKNVLTVEIDRLDAEVVRELIAVYRSVKQTNATAVVLRLGDVQVEYPDDRTSWSVNGQLLTALITNCGIPSVAVLAGQARAEVAELAFACHYRVSAAGRGFALAPAGEAYFPRWGTFARIAQIVGRPRAVAELLAGNHAAIAALFVDNAASGAAADGALDTLLAKLAAADPGLRRLALIALGDNPLRRNPDQVLETSLFENLGKVPLQAIAFQPLEQAAGSLMKADITSDLDDFGIDYVPFDRPSGAEKQALARKNRVAEVSMIIDQTEIPIRGRCIELGAGHGYFSVLLSRKPAVEKVVALDISAASILRWGPFIWDWLKPDWSKLTYAVADMNQLEHEFGTYDTVVFCASLHHSSDIPKSMRIANRLLKPGGVVVLHGEHYDPRWLRSKQRKKDSHVPHTIPEFEALLTDTGFEPKVLRYALPGQRFPRLKRLLFTQAPFKLINGNIKFANYIMCGIKR